MGYFDGKGANGFGGILGKMLQNQYDTGKGGAMAEALRRIAAAKTEEERFEGMADYGDQGYNPNDLREFNKIQKQDYGYAKSAGDSIIDVRTGKPIYLSPQKAEKPSYNYIREVGGSLVDVRTGEPIFTADPKPKDHNVPIAYGNDVRGYLDSTRGVNRDKNGGYVKGSADPLAPDIEDTIARRASEIYKETGNPEEAQQRAYGEVVGNRKLVPSGDTGIENDGSSPWYKPDKNFQYMKPEGYQSGVTKEGSGRTLREGQKAVNKQTGETMTYRNGEWVK